MRLTPSQATPDPQRLTFSLRGFIEVSDNGMADVNGIVRWSVPVSPELTVEGIALDSQA
jgi:hypothetical protein